MGGNNMQEQNYLVISKTTFATSVYECETQEEVKEIVSQLIEKGVHPASIRVTKEIPVDITVKVDVEFQV